MYTTPVTNVCFNFFISSIRMKGEGHIPQRLAAKAVHGIKIFGDIVFQIFINKFTEVIMGCELICDRIRSKKIISPDIKKNGMQRILHEVT